MQDRVDNSSEWVYDLAVDRDKNIVALNYHLAYERDCFCLSDCEDELLNECLFVYTSMLFSTLAQARQHALSQKDKFVKGLD